MAEVVGDRCLEGQSPQHALVDDQIEAVDLQVVGGHLPGQVRAPLPGGLEGLGENGFGEASHAEHLLAKLRHHRVEGSHVARSLPAR